MPRTHPPYSPAIRQQIVELYHAGRSIAELSREFEPTAEAMCITSTSILRVRQCVNRIATSIAMNRWSIPTRTTPTSITVTVMDNTIRWS